MSENYEFKDNDFICDPFHTYQHSDNPDSVIVIDNGSHSCRAGWSHSSEPELVFRNLVAKLRGKKENDNSANVFFGNDITDLEDMKWNVRTQFDMDTVTHFDTQEIAFDYIFSHLGIDTESVQHPVCISESVCIPNTFRHHMSEMLFECYDVPKVIYGVDSLFSWRHNTNDQIKDGLIVRCGYQTTHVLPIVDGVFKAADSRRLNVGGLNMMMFLRRLMQLRHPTHSANLNLSRAQELLIGHTYVATDYFAELKRWQSGMEFEGRRPLSIQLPLVNTTTEKDLELRKVQARRLKEINQKKREEKLKNETEQLKKFEEIIDLEMTNLTLFKQRLKQEGLKKESDLHTIIKELNDKIEERKEKSRIYLLGLRDSVKEEASESLDDIIKTIDDLEEEKMTIMDRRRSRTSRKQALNKRKSYASKERMRILSQLAKANSSSPKVQKEDTFGMKDEDWDVYKYINKDGSESEDEQDQERLNEIEQHLSQNQLTMNKLMVGRGKIYQYLPFDTEQIRAPEVLYQPHVVGVDQEGITGMTEYVLRNFTTEKQSEMVQNVLCTGSLSLLPGFRERLEVELMAILPFQTKFNVNIAKSPLRDAWYGARDCVNSVENLDSIAITRPEYDEMGVGYLKEHACSNIFVDIEE